MNDKPAVAPLDDAPDAPPPSTTPAALAIPAEPQKIVARESLYSPWIRGATAAILVKRVRLGVRS